MLLWGMWIDLCLCLVTRNFIDTMLTKEYLNTLVVDTQYYIFPGTTVTVCCITLQNGFGIVGESACIDPANFNAKIGEEIAYQKAFEKLWMLEGYHQKASNGAAQTSCNNGCSGICGDCSK